MRHPYKEGVSTETALNLARTLKYGPLPRPSDPTPSVDEGIEILREAIRTSSMNSPLPKQPM